MIRKLQYAMMILPILLAAWLCFASKSSNAIPAEQVVAIDLAEFEEANQLVALQNAPETDEQVPQVEVAERE